MDTQPLEESLPFSAPSLDALAFDALPAHIAIIDRQGAILSVNRAWADFAEASGAGDAARVSVGTNYLDVCRRADTSPEGQAALNGIQFVLSGRCPQFVMEYPCHAPDRDRWFLLQVAPLAKPGEGAVIAHLDITAQKQAEAALREADRRKDEFLAMLAHELRNPLAPMRNAVEILKRTGPDKSRLDWACGLISRQLAHLVNLTDDLLEVSRLVRGHIVLRKEAVDLGAVLHQAVELNRPLLDERHHRLTVLIPPNPVQIEGDRSRLVQIVGNLLNNAAKYTPEAGQISLSLEAGADAVALRVKDNGVGLSTELQVKVFELFTQASRTLARTEGGLGIGLALVRHLVDLHGGRVRASSAGPGLGSEFEVILPRGGHGPSGSCRDWSGEPITNNLPAPK